MITDQHLGIILTVIGAFLLAFAVSAKRLYFGPIAKVVDRLKSENPELIEPTETKINYWLLALGLSLVVFGAWFAW